MSDARREAGSRGLRISEKLRRAASQPCAIIGMACRLPGAPDLDQLRDLLRAGREGIGDIPAERWDRDAFYSPERGVPGRMISRRGGFIEGLDRFASDFFEISPREAAAMDPQQRLLLEVAWHAFESAGLPPARLARSRTAVFIGMSSLDPAVLASREAPDGYKAAGTAWSIAAGRISYLFDLRGPCLVIDTSCSSSLVALHQACASLQRAEADAALVGGVNVLLDPRSSVALSHSGMLAPDGRCKTFDDGADGYVRGEGCAALVVKRLRDAERDQDRVMAVIRGSAVNHDGRTQGITAPSGVAQRAVIRQALEEAGLRPDDVQVLEAHGTGTALGDPQELDAIGDVFAGRERRLIVGSIKTNLGHLEPVAGLAGVLKLVLGLQHREIYPHLHLRRTNREIPMADLPVSIPTELRPWPAEPGRPRVGAVSSFGFSGTNAHVVLEESPSPAQPAAAGARLASTDTAAATLPLALSARSDGELRALAARHADHLRRMPGVDLADLCYTAATSRAAWSHRCVLPARSSDELIRALDQVAAGRTRQGAVVGQARRGPPPKIAFLFTGQGSQYPGMAAGLFEGQPIFRAALERCAELFRGELPRPLLDVMFDRSGSPAIDDTLYTQPALFATGWALSELWRSCGVEPAVVLGHSVGEIAAACVAGAIELADAARFVAARARLMQDRMGDGAMLAVLDGPEVAEEAVARRRDDLSVAAYNGPSLAVVSGRARAVADVEAELQARGIRTRRLRTSRAFHSPLVEPLVADIERAAAGMQTAAPRYRIASNVSGALFAAGEAPTAAYWARQAREPVRFEASVRAALDHGCSILLELGPDPVLLGMARGIAREGVVAVASLRRASPDLDTIVDAAAALHVEGAPLLWEHLDPRPVRRRVTLPSYPFARRQFPLLRRAPGGDADSHTAEAHARATSSGRGWLQLRPMAPDLPVAMFELQLAAESLGVLADHRMRGAAVMPAAALLELMLSSAREAFGARRARLDDISFPRALVCAPGQPRRVVVSLARLGRDGAAVQVASQPAAGAWTTHAEARLWFGRDGGPPAVDADALELLKALLSDEASVEELYARLARGGLEYGPGFRGLVQAFSGDPGSGEALGRVAVPPPARLEDATWLHPVLLDSAFHLIALAVAAVDPEPTAAPEAARVPVGIDRIELGSPIGPEGWAHARARRDGDDIRVDIDLWGASGERWAGVRGLRLVPLSVTQHAAAAAQREADRPHGDAAPPEVLHEPGDSQSTILEELARAAPVERIDLLIEFIRGQMADVMKLEPGDLEDGPDLLLLELGFDSLMAVELQRRLQIHLGFSMPPGVDMGGFNYSTIEDLAQLLLAKVIHLEASPADGLRN